MEARRLEPDLAVMHGQMHTLRLLEGKSAAPETRALSLRAWILLFGSLSFSGGHGIFLFTALTRLAKLPGRGELGEGFELVVLGWFLAAAPLALLAAFLRRRFLALTGLTAWSLASAVFTATLVAFGWYLHAVALA
ncbi:MAG TPA: hypothetical protein VF530_00050 [Planctomycetota bacterium]